MMDKSSDNAATLEDLRLPSGQIVVATIANKSQIRLVLKVKSKLLLEFSFSSETDTLEFPGSFDLFDLWLALFSIFQFYPQITEVNLSSSTIIDDSQLNSLVVTDPQDRIFCPRSVFYQAAIPAKGELSGWILNCPTTANVPAYFVTDKSSAGSTVRHPVRPVHLPVNRYARYIPSLGKMLELHALQKHDEADVDAFSQWMNNDRVAKFWGMKGDKEVVHRPYIEKMDKDRHITQIIGTLDGERFLYTGRFTQSPLRLSY